MAETASAHDPLIDKLPARYVVGIDLGTTNSAVMWVDTQASPWQVHMQPLPQLVAPHQVEARDTLPSFHLQLPEHLAAEAVQLPWAEKGPDWCVGVMAREEGAKLPGRQIASAKSWLCHSGVDRSAALLPWQGLADVERLSPVDVSARYLDHIRAAWDDQHPEHLLADQDVVITLPASFDEVARELTVAAAAEARLNNVVLIEEPQAAFYAWVNKHKDAWADLVRAGDTILVCDIGGGTCDFTLIKVRPGTAGQGDQVQFHRIAVGDHLILGGDNLDLALAQYVEQKLAGTSLTPTQWDALVRSCRRVKETLLSPEAPESTTIHLPGTGAKLIGGGLQIEVSREEVVPLLVDGFLPRVSLQDPVQQGQSGFREFGLPFASDPAITRHLAAFLRAHAEVANGEHHSEVGAAVPHTVLFNGGFFASAVLRDRLLEVLTSWYPTSVEVLDHDRLDLAVARGAAYYGMVRRGEGVRIAANLARTYYMEVASGEATRQAVCVVPGHAQPGETIDLDALPLSLTISEPVEFSLWVSSTRLTDGPGEVIDIDPEQMRPLAPIRTVLRTDRRNQTGELSVTLHAHLSEIGTMDLWCQAAEHDHRWRLQFDVRGATQTDHQEQQTSGEQQGVLDEATWERCEEAIAAVFGPAGGAKPGLLVKELASILDQSRDQWPTSLLRRIWECLLRHREGRRRSPAHEARWLNLLGFSLRPGYGLAVDDWRVVETWRHVRGKLVHAGASGPESQILWRRIAGGLSAGQQRALAEPLLAALRSAHASATRGKKAKANAAFPLHSSSEAWRLLGSLELLGLPAKLDAGTMLVDLLGRPKYAKMTNSMIWALGRLGQRQPLYGPLNTVAPAEQAAAWAQALLTYDESDATPVALMQLTRQTGDRYRDVTPPIRDTVVQWLKHQDAAEHLIELVSAGGELAQEEQDQVFGEALPQGFRLSR